MLTHKHTEESKQKMRLKALGRKITPEAKEKMRNAKLGKKHTFEHNKKIGISCLGKIRTIHFRKNLSQLKTGEHNPMWKGGVSFYRSIHRSLTRWSGKAKQCDNREMSIFSFNCSQKSYIFDWAKKENSEYTTNVQDYFQLCRSCHKKYDFYAAKGK